MNTAANKCILRKQKLKIRTFYISATLAAYILLCSINIGSIEETSHMKIKMFLILFFYLCNVRSSGVTFTTLHFLCNLRVGLD